MQWYLMHEMMDLIGIPDILVKMTFVVYFPWIRIFMYTPYDPRTFHTKMQGGEMRTVRVGYTSRSRNHNPSLPCTASMSLDGSLGRQIPLLGLCPATCSHRH